MQYKLIEIDVSRLVEVVQRRQLLFYPLMIFLLTRVLKNFPLFADEHPLPLYQLRNQQGQVLFVWQEICENWEDFFRDYVRVCYEHLEKKVKLPQGTLPEKYFGVFCFTDTALPEACSQIPVFGLHEFCYRQDKIILPLELRGWDNLINVAQFEQRLVAAIATF